MSLAIKRLIISVKKTRSVKSSGVENGFLANVNFRYLLSFVRLSVVCNARAPYSGGLKFRQFFYTAWYLGHPLTSTEKLTEIVPGKPLRRGS